MISASLPWSPMASMPEVLCGYHLSVLEPSPELDGGFLAWLCRAEPLNDQFKLAANGVTRFGLGQYPIKNAFVALPPLDTQQRIARFLDEKTARIDGLIEKKRALAGPAGRETPSPHHPRRHQGPQPRRPLEALGHRLAWRTSPRCWEGVGGMTAVFPEKVREAYRKLSARLEVGEAEVLRVDVRNSNVDKTFSVG